MARDAYPKDASIRGLVEKSGVTVPDALVDTGYADAAVAEFEKRTGRIPFRADVSDVIRYFDPPGPSSKLETQYYRGGEKILELDAGLVSCTSITLGYTADNVGQTMDLARQLQLGPVNAPAKGQPYEWVEFFFPVYGAPGSIKIVGKWGYSTTVPEDVYQAIIRLGASMLAKDVLQGIISGPSKFKQGDETIEQDAYEDLGRDWEAYASRVIERYKLLRVGL